MSGSPFTLRSVLNRSKLENTIMNNNSLLPQINFQNSFVEEIFDQRVLDNALIWNNFNIIVHNTGGDTPTLCLKIVH